MFDYKIIAYNKLGKIQEVENLFVHQMKLMV